MGQRFSRIRKKKPGRGRTWEAFYIGEHSFPGPLKATAGRCLYSLFLRVGEQLGFFVSWIAAIGLTELPFFCELERNSDFS